MNDTNATYLRNRARQALSAAIAAWKLVEDAEKRNATNPNVSEETRAAAERGAASASITIDLLTTLREQ